MTPGHTVLEFGLVDGAAAMLDEVGDQLENLRLDGHQGSIAPEFTRGDVQFAACKPVNGTAVAGHRAGHPPSTPRNHGMFIE
jgi:hypothetical protein